MIINWKNYEKEKPKSSGFYFVKWCGSKEIMYYCKTIDEFLYFEDDFILMYPLETLLDFQWAKMPRFCKSKLLHDGYMEIEDRYNE